MLTWWLQADIHFNDEDYFQQNLQLTLQAMSMDVKDKIINLKSHQEIEEDLTVIITGQISTWLECNLKKCAIYTTGKGDIVFRVLFATSAKNFLQADEALRVLKVQLETSIYRQFGLCLGSKLLSTSLLAVNASEEPPAIKPVENKHLVLLLNSEDVSKDEDLCRALYKKFEEFEDYTSPEVNELIGCSSIPDDFLMPPPPPCKRTKR